MKCPNCNTENRDGAKFCRNCRKELEHKELNIRERYPEYSFEPTSITMIKGDAKWWYLTVLLFILSILLMLLSFIVFNRDDTKGPLFFILAMMIILFLKIPYSKTQKMNVTSMCDYIECDNGLSHYRFAIKDSKFGVFNIKKRVLQIPCEYEYLEWSKQDKILMATMNGNHFEIDINGNKLK